MTGPPQGHPGPYPGAGDTGPGQGRPYPQYIPPGHVPPGHAPPGQGPPSFSPPGSGYAATARFSQGRHRPHWATAVLRALTISFIYFVLFGFSLLLRQTDSGGVVVEITPEVVRRFWLVTAPVVAIAVFLGVWSWLSTMFWIDQTALMVETGILRKRRRRIPLSKVQAIDVVRPLVTRALGLAEVRVELAGGDAAEIALRYLDRTAARDLRAELLARAAGLPGHTPQAPERPFWRVKQGTLFGSLTLKLPVIGAGALFVVLLTVGGSYGEAGVLGAAIPLLLGLLRAVVAPLIVYGNFTVATSPDGLRVRSGLFETRLQTVPPGRVQAVRIVEPLLWRPYRWARVDVTVAGYSGERQVLSSVLLPAAPREVAMRLVAEIFPGTDVDAVRLSPSSPRAFWAKAAAGSDNHVFVTRRGMACQRLDVIAHARAQSVHIVSGPLQWLLGIGTVRIDAPPGPVQVAAVNRDLGEARVIAEATTERARRARATDRPPGPWAR
jgi:putative membrane protein